MKHSDPRSQRTGVAFTVNMKPERVLGLFKNRTIRKNRFQCTIRHPVSKHLVLKNFDVHMRHMRKMFSCYISGKIFYFFVRRRIVYRNVIIITISKNCIDVTDTVNIFLPSNITLTSGYNV